MRRLDFPLRPHLLKYLVVYLKLHPQAERPDQLEDYVLSNTGQWGLPLTVLLGKPAKSARHEGSIEDCTARLGVNLRNFRAPYYDLVHGKLSPWVVFQFNDYVEDIFRRELYWWVASYTERRGTIKEGILSYMALYGISEQELPFETLRKDVQRNADLPVLKKKAEKSRKDDFFSTNLSRKTGDLSRKTGKVSRKIGVLSHKEVFGAVRQELTKLPLPIFGAEFYFGPGSTHAHAGR